MAIRKLFRTADDLRDDDQLSSFSNDETLVIRSDSTALRFDTTALLYSNSGSVISNHSTAAEFDAALIDVSVIASAGSSATFIASEVIATDADFVSADRLPDDVFISPIPGDELHAALQQAASLMRLDQVRANPLYTGVDGHGETVVIIDSGADLNHSFFGPDANSNGVADRILFQFDFFGSNDSDASDGNGHGTHVTGIVGSQDSTYKGMAPGTTFIILKVLNDAGSGNSGDIAEAFSWVVNNRASFPNIVAVSMSIGIFSNVNSDQTTVITNQVQTLWNAGIATVIAAGNDYASFNAPGVNSLAATPLAWGVASTLDNGNTFSSFSQRSSTMTELAAPGSDITSSWLNNTTNTISGTSMATPMISGLVALAQDLSQEITGGTRMTPAAILNIMRTTGVNITDGTTTVPRVDALNLMNGIVSFWQQSTGNLDNIYGWRGNDSLSGQGGDDNIRGNLGNDSIDGGPGTDRAIFSGLRAAYTLTDLGGGSVRVSGPDGTDTVSNVERLVFDDQTINWPLPPGSVSIDDVSLTEGNAGTKLMTFTVARTGGTAAFAVNYATANGTATTADGDYVATSNTLNFGANENTKTISVTINGDTKIESNETFFVNLSGATSGATIIDNQGTGTVLNDDGIASHDFDGDARSDILWHHTSGLTSIYEMNGGQVKPGGALTVANIDPSWRIMGTGDFDGDGKTGDILWHHTSGLTSIYEMNGGQVKPGGALTVGNLDPTWHIVGAADFDGDGKTDILWRHTSGLTSLYEMDGGVVKPGGALTIGSVDPSWNVAGTGDFDGDGKADILWRHSSGLTSIFEMNGGVVKPGGALTIGTVDPSWIVAGTGDFDGDGKSDILWRHSSGLTSIYEMDGGQIKPGGAITIGTVDPSWQVSDTGDFNADGRADILWHHSSGLTSAYLMNGGAHVDVTIGIVDPSWQINSHHFDLI